jgi:hypothetical protein
LPFLSGRRPAHGVRTAQPVQSRPAATRRGQAD